MQKDATTTNQAQIETNGAFAKNIFEDYCNILHEAPKQNVPGIQFRIVDIYAKCMPKQIINCHWYIFVDMCLNVDELYRRETFAQVIEVTHSY